MKPLHTHVRPAGRSAFSLVEVVFVMAILITGMGMFVHTISSTSKLGPVNRETELAMSAGRAVIEQLRSENPTLVFARYNADPADDPLGPGTGPGVGFAVAGLVPVDGDADGLAGEVVLPTLAGELREDLVDPVFGFPRDLNGDGAIDVLTHEGDYQVLPILVRIRWTGQVGPRVLELYTALEVM
jgi:type II secretory pathway pseudopilin PulG